MSKRHHQLPKEPKISQPPEGMDRRQWEQDKYRTLYRDFDYGHNWKHPEFDEWWKDKEGSVLDIGCGTGWLLRRVAPSDCLGYEVVELLCGTIVEEDQVVGNVCHFEGMHSIPEPDNSWDWVTCCDALEHVLEEDSIAGLREMVRIARKGLYLTIAWGPDNWGQSISRDTVLHINRHDKSWWLAHITAFVGGMKHNVLRDDHNGMDVEVML